ncbi:hypothetical protein [Calothrix sp. NIES-3974]|nr:hypothetical protein [Calothrix sp. NIES-3974]BAZ07034.1 hypothetical protein NIES3974_36960 [Calothrix sp. NIES-3974]
MHLFVVAQLRAKYEDTAHRWFFLADLLNTVLAANTVRRIYLSN